jgi:hypothetical protein
VQDRAGAGQTEIGGRYAHYVFVILTHVYVFDFIDRQFLSILARSSAKIGVSDADMRAGADPGIAPRDAMSFGLAIALSSVALLLAARFLPGEEATRIERARAPGEPV